MPGVERPEARAPDRKGVRHASYGYRAAKPRRFSALRSPRWGV
jgi:hypothetical protein